MSDDNLRMPAPNTSMYKVIQFLNKELFLAEKRRLNKVVSDLIINNNEIAGTQAAGFLYEGEYYTAIGFAISQGVSKIQLAEALYGKMIWHLKDSQEVADDERMICQMIFKLLDPCETLQDMRDSLPDCLAEMVPALKPIPRHNEVGYSIHQDTRSWRQFNKLLPKIEMYSAARLLY